MVNIASFQNFTIDELIDIRQQINKLISYKEKQELERDNSLEEGFRYLIDTCFEKDKRIVEAVCSCGRELSIDQAKFAHELLKKYRNDLPRWRDIEHQYSFSNELPLGKYRLVVVSDRVHVHYPFSREINAIVKSVKGYRFHGDSPSKHWSLPLSSVEEIALKFDQKGWNWDLNLEIELYKSFIDKNNKLIEIENKVNSDRKTIDELIKIANLDKQLPNGWYLRDYQKEGVKFLLSNSKKFGQYNGALLCDDMGLGKTIQTLIAIKAMQQKYDCSAFVIAPVSLLDNWRRESKLIGCEIETFSQSYQSIPEPLESKPFLVVVDEAHGFQNMKSKRTQKLLELINHPNNLGIYLLTGTPMRNGRPLNLLSLLKFVGHEVAKDSFKYKVRYCNGHKTNFGWDFTGSSHLKELSDKLSSILLRRNKKDCLKELPEKTRIIDKVTLTATKKKQYKAKLKELILDYRERAKSGEVDISAEKLVTLNFMRREASIFKIDSALELARELLDQDQQVVLFTDFVDSAKELHNHLGGEILTGETKDRQGAVDRFQSGESKVFISTIKAGGVGLTLTAASNLIMVDRSWTPGDVYQAEDRIHRISQTYPVLVRWLQYGIDNDIDELIQSKQSVIDEILKGKSKVASVSDKELIDKLMSKFLKKYK